MGVFNAAKIDREYYRYDSLLIVVCDFLKCQRRTDIANIFRMRSV